MSGCPISQSVSHCGVPTRRRNCVEGERPGKPHQGRGRGSVRCWLLALVGPVAVGVRPPSQSSQVLWRLSRGAMMRRRSSVATPRWTTCDGVLALVGRSAYPWDGALGLIRRSVATSSLGPPPSQDGVDAARCPGQLVFQHGVAAGASLADAALDVGQGVGQVDAVCGSPVRRGDSRRGGRAVSGRVRRIWFTQLPMELQQRSCWPRYRCAFLPATLLPGAQWSGLWTGTGSGGQNGAAAADPHRRRASHAWPAPWCRRQPRIPRRSRQAGLSEIANPWPSRPPGWPSSYCKPLLRWG